MKIVINELQEIQAKLLMIDTRLVALLSEPSEPESITMLEEAYKLLQEELLEVHKLENLIMNRKLLILEKKVKANLV